MAKSTIGVLGQMSIPSQPVFSYEEYERRWNKVRSSMAESNIDALITFNVENIFYLTGMDSENFFDYQCVILPIVDGEPKLIILDFESARAENSSITKDIYTYGAFDDHLKFTLQVTTGLSDIKRIAIDRTVKESILNPLCVGLESKQLSDAFGLVESARLVKSKGEIEYMEKAAQLTDCGVRAGYEAIQAGVEDREVAAAIIEAMYRAGSDTVCWGPVVAAGYRAGTAHSTFNGHIIQSNETVFMELTGESSRYVSPLMRTAVVGDALDNHRKVEQCVQAALAGIISTASAGTPACEVAAKGLEALQDVLPDHIFHHNFGYPVGIGYPGTWIEQLNFLIRADNDRPLLDGMVFHLPISIRKYGEYDVNLSHTMVVESGGGRILGNSVAQLESV